MNNDDLLAAFTASKLPVGHLDAFKAGAAQGYLMAKRQMVEAIDKQIDNIDSDFNPFYGLERVRDYVRNVMLWKKP